MHSKNEETEAESAERYDEFGYPRQQQDAAASCARRLSVQSSRSQSNKSPLPLTSSDEGIESDASDLRSSSGGGGGGGKRRGSRCWSFDSSATSASSMSGGSSVAEDEAMILLLEQQHSDEPSPKSKVVRCCSSDSAVLSDDDQSKGENDSSGASAAAASPTTTSSSSCPRSAGRYWRTPSVVVSDYSDYSYLEERFERSDDSELDRVDCCGGGNGGPAGCSRASSCSYLNIDDDDDRDDDFFDDTSGFEITTAAGLSARGVTTRRRRHSDSCCLRPTWTRSNSHQAGGAAAGVNSGRRNSCLATSSRLAPNDSGSDQPDGVCDPTLAAGPNYEEEVVAGTAPDLELLCPPPQRKISDCSTLSSLSGDDESADFGQLVAAAGHKRSQELAAKPRVIPRIVYTRPSFCNDEESATAACTISNSSAVSSSSSSSSNNNVSAVVIGKLSAAAAAAAAAAANRKSLQQSTTTTTTIAPRHRKIARSRVKRSCSRRPSSRSSSSSRSPSPAAANHANDNTKRVIISNGSDNDATGYSQYLLQVPLQSYQQQHGAPGQFDWSDNSNDDLSSEWDSDQSLNYRDESNEESIVAADRHHPVQDEAETRNDADTATEVPRLPVKSSGWRKLRSIVHWTPFFQTYKKQRYPWVQLAGHQGNFRPGPKPGTILKKLCPQEEACFQLLMKDVLRPYVPEYLGALELRSEEQQPPAKVEAAVEASQTATDNHKNNNVNNNNINNNYNNNNNNNSNSNSNGATGCKDSYLQLQDLLADFKEPCVMDCKVGVRTYLESELAKAKERPKLRKDMYEKMVQVDPTAPSDEERQLQGVTKPRYMVWRETISSTATLGFRVEGIKLAQAGSSKDFKTTRTRQQVMDAIRRFVEGYPHAAGKYLQRLQAIRATLRASSFFAGHEVVGSSLLFVHDARAAGVWMIDFAKTLPLPEHLERIRHDAVWQVGNHEDGYLIGVNNLIDIFKEIVADGVAAVDGGVEAAAAAEAVVVDDHDGPT
ncbi:serine-rich adhesin for platelets isoform X1 [Trichogramma pretiosum]|uniref:serine-rich adhesin for platelets isoform X1 n=1 Tax=Trichogramma pretiosum TaxID=7493 RepID=UPI0006C9663C|nr:serine-rich adhesin for platelets isoform X1 [Trichogramma pretiosum]